MKVVRTKNPKTPQDKNSTKIGEVYSNIAATNYYLRSPDGFVNLTTAHTISLETALPEGWVHHPDAELHIPE